MATLTIYADSDGYITSADPDYATCRTGAGEAATDSDGSGVKCGQEYDGVTDYHGYRGGVRFDTSIATNPLLSGATITGVDFKGTPQSFVDDRSFDITVRRAAWAVGISSDPSGNWDALIGGTLEGTLVAVTSAVVDTTNTLAVNPAGIVDGFVYYSLIASTDAAASAPGGGSEESLTIYDTSNATNSKRPQLVIAYTPAAGGQPTTVRNFGTPFARLPGQGGARLGG